jgi:hypothetical protein
MQVTFLHPKATMDHVGIIPDMIRESDPRPAREQLHTGYSHGGGWHPFNGFTLNANDTLSYPGDPPVIPLAEIRLREERIVIYRHAWVAIIQPNRSFEVCRMD